MTLFNELKDNDHIRGIGTIALIQIINYINSLSISVQDVCTIITTLVYLINVAWRWRKRRKSELE